MLVKGEELNDQSFLVYKVMKVEQLVSVSIQLSAIHLTFVSPNNHHFRSRYSQNTVTKLNLRR